MDGFLKKIALTAIAGLALTACTAIAAPAASSAWIVLDSGRQGDYLWSVKASRSGGPDAAGSQSDAHKPCLLVGTKWLRGRFSYGGSRYRQCADTAGSLAANEAPLVASGVVAEQRPAAEADGGGDDLLGEGAPSSDHLLGRNDGFGRRE